MSHNAKKYSSSSSSSASSSPDHLTSKRRSVSDESSSGPMTNVFANDGSFLEMFKKYQQKQSKEVTLNDKKKVETSKPVVTPEAQPTGTSSSKSTPVIPVIGKRRGGKILPTGRVKKVKNEDEEDEDDVKPKDAWSVYMSEVKRYKDTVCQGDDKTRPLVK